MRAIHWIITVIVLWTIPKINGKPDWSAAPKGRLLTPEEGCGYSKVQHTKIVGGTIAKNGDWPWFAILLYEIGNVIYSNGGGSLITSRHVLTAAHCIVHRPQFVRLGEYDTTTTSDGAHEDIMISHFEAHENYKPYIFDIALLTLDRDVEFNDRISPICLPIFGELLHRRFVNAYPFVVGFGKQHEAGKTSTVVMQVHIPIMENIWCRKLYGKSYGFDDRTICAGFMRGGKDSCQGDSGGPLMLPIAENGSFPFYQIGIVSWGGGCARAYKPGIYTNIQFESIAKWIESKISH